jgi:hypothetical protein
MLPVSGVGKSCVAKLEITGGPLLDVRVKGMWGYDEVRGMKAEEMIRAHTVSRRSKTPLGGVIPPASCVTLVFITEC